jgi:hypothetical protein
LEGRRNIRKQVKGLMVGRQKKDKKAGNRSGWKIVER